MQLHLVVLLVAESDTAVNNEKCNEENAVGYKGKN